MPDKGNKRRAVPTDGKAHKDESGIKELLDNVAKLSLASALSARVVRSIVLDGMQAPIAEPIISEMTTATKAYADAHRPATRKQRAKMGMPHRHAWNAMLAQIVKEALPQGAELKAIKDYSDFVKQSPDPAALLTLQVRYERVCKCYDKTMKKLEVNCFPNSQSYILWQLIKLYLITGCRELPGVAPMGDLERRIQKAIDEHKGDDMAD